MTVGRLVKINQKMKHVWSLLNLFCFMPLLRVEESSHFNRGKVIFGLSISFFHVGVTKDTVLPHCFSPSCIVVFWRKKYFGAYGLIC